MLAQTVADHHLHGPMQRHRIVIPAGQGLGSQFAVNGNDRHGDALDRQLSPCC